MKNWKQWHFFLCSPTFTIWCFPSSILPALSLPPCVLSMSSPWAPYHPPLPGNHPGIAFNQVSSSSRCFPGLWSGFAPSSLAFVTWAGMEGTHPLLAHLVTSCSPKRHQKEIWREGKKTYVSQAPASSACMPCRAGWWVGCPARFRMDDVTELLGGSCKDLSKIHYNILQAAAGLGPCWQPRVPEVETRAGLRSLSYGFPSHLLTAPQWVSALQLSWQGKKKLRLKWLQFPPGITEAPSLSSLVTQAFGSISKHINTPSSFMLH